ncbi:MAG: hypothetical protein AABX99_03075 [Nanoarchaeota archaeon]
MGLTEKEKSDHKKNGQGYKILIEANSPTISVLRRHHELREHLEELEKKLLESMPKTPNGKFPCEECGVKSMEYIRDKGNLRIYECEICGKNIADKIK